MQVSNKKYFKQWLNQLKLVNPEKPWREFLERDDLPPLTLSFEASAVYSSNFEGNTIDLNSFMNSKLSRNGGSAVPVLKRMDVNRRPCFSF